MSGFHKGGMYVLSSPSGAGKTTLVKKISKNKNYIVSISHTTRLPRPKEKDGKDYYFVSKNNFKKLIKNEEFLEHAKVFDNYYGSSKKIVIDKLKQGKNIIFDVDVNAGETVLLEPAYPIVIESTGDQISVGAGTSTVNFFITGDKEA